MDTLLSVHDFLVVSSKGFCVGFLFGLFSFVIRNVCRTFGFVMGGRPSMRLE